MYASWRTTVTFSATSACLVHTAASKNFFAPTITVRTTSRQVTFFTILLL
jgi:hypothetical protein